MLFGKTSDFKLLQLRNATTPNSLMPRGTEISDEVPLYFSNISPLIIKSAEFLMIKTPVQTKMRPPKQGIKTQTPIVAKLT